MLKTILKCFFGKYLTRVLPNMVLIDFNDFMSAVMFLSLTMLVKGFLRMGLRFSETGYRSSAYASNTYLFALLNTNFASSQDRIVTR